MKGFWTAILAAAASSAGAGELPPTRIVSGNLCADRLVLQMVEPDKVASVSAFAADPEVSTVAEAARGIPVHQGSTEEILSLRPDLVVLGSFRSLATAAMLRTMGVKVHVLAAADSIPAVRAVIRALAQDLGVTARGEVLIAHMDARLAALPIQAPPAKAVVYQAGGWSAGSNTMADDLFTRTGFSNLAAQVGIKGFGSLPLETLVAAAPDVIVFESSGDNTPSIAADLLRHPALSLGPSRKVGIPMRLWACPDPALVDAAAMMAGAGS